MHSVSVPWNKNVKKVHERETVVPFAVRLEETVI
jgi:hypothetical protein